MDNIKSLGAVFFLMVVLLLAPAEAGSFVGGGTSIGADSGHSGEVASITSNAISSTSASSIGPIDLNIYKKAIRADNVFAETQLQVSQGIINSYTASAVPNKNTGAMESKATLDVDKALDYTAQVDAGRYINSPTYYAEAKVDGSDGSLKGWSGSAYATTSTAQATQSFTRADGSDVFMKGYAFTPTMESKIFADVDAIGAIDPALLKGITGSLATKAIATLPYTTSVDLIAHAEGDLYSRGEATDVTTQVGDSDAPIIADLGLHANTPSNVWGTSIFYVDLVTPANGIQDAVNGAWDGDTIALNKGDYYQQNIQVAKDLKFLGTSSLQVNLFGQNNQLFNILPTATVTMDRMTIRGGQAYDGGAIYNAGDLTVGSDTVFKNNDATGYGGAIYNDAGAKLTSNGATFDSNTANFEGGAILNKGGGSTTINGGALHDNSVNCWGGAISNYGSMIVNNANIYANTANDAGAIINWGTLDVNGGHIHHNTATSQAEGAGAIYNLGGTTIEGLALIDYNSANYGGAIYNKAGTVDIKGSAQVNSNTANNDGGAIYNSGGSVTVENSAKVNSNTATNGNGGAIFNTIYDDFGTIYTGTVDIKGSAQVNSNTANNNGGAIFNDRGSVTVENYGQVNSNTATNLHGGAIYSTGSTATVDMKNNAQINNNNAVNGNGGALYNVYGSTATMRGNAQMSGNHAGWGGAVWNGYSGSSFTMNGNALLNSNTATANGGAILSTEGAVVTLNDNSKIQNNQANGNGGAIFNMGSTVTMNDATSINHNTANFGGAIWNGKNGMFVMNGGAISYNTAVNGGAIYNDLYGGVSAVLSLNHGTIDQNTATGVTGTGGRGGAIYNDGGAVNLNSASGVPMLIQHNTANAQGTTIALQGRGGGIYNRGYVSIATNSFIMYNDAQGTITTSNPTGSGIKNAGTSPVVAGSLTNVNSNTGGNLNQIA